MHADDVCRGRPRTIDDERVAQLIKTTRHTKPAHSSTHRSVRTVAAERGISKTSVQRYFQQFGPQPHRTAGFKLSNDPVVDEKQREVVGLSLSPPDNARVICVDERSQIDKAVPAKLDIYCVADNYATHNPRRSRRGWRRGRAGACTSSRPTVPGSIKSNASSP